MGQYKGIRKRVRIDGETYTIAQLAKKLGITPFATLRRYNHRKERGMELSLRVLAKSLNGTPKRLMKPRPLGLLAARIRSHMIVQGRSMKDLAASIKVHTATVTRLLTDKRSINPKRLEQIVDWLMLTDEEERDLHILAAREHGWKV